MGGCFCNNQKGDDFMAYETKAIFSLLADSIAKAKSVKEAYNVVARAANVEGVKLPTYDEYIKMLEKENEK